MGFLAKLMDIHQSGGSNYNKFTLLSNDESSDVTIADYVIEQGTSGIWSYRKWASGKSECWGAKTTTSSATTSEGGGYRTDAVSENFPSNLFTSGPVVNCDIQAGSVILTAVCIANASATNTGNWCGYRVSSNSNTGTKYFNFTAKGKWK